MKKLATDKYYVSFWTRAVQQKNVVLDDNMAELLWNIHLVGRQSDDKGNRVECCIVMDSVVINRSVHSDVPPRWSGTTTNSEM